MDIVFDIQDYLNYIQHKKGGDTSLEAIVKRLLIESSA